MVITMVCAISLEAQNKSFYDFNVTTIDGKEFPLSSLKGKKVLVVNVASKCGLTPQYAKLQELYPMRIIIYIKPGLSTEAIYDQS